MSASDETSIPEQNSSFIGGKNAFRAICVVYGIWILFLAAVVWQVVQR